MDGEDKDYGYIVDYKDLFTKVENAIAVYAEELDHEEGQTRPEITVNDRLELARNRLDIALEAVEELCEPVEPPKETLNYIRYFCGNSDVAGDLEATAPKRQALYQLTAALIRAYANVANDMEAAGYNDHQARQISHA